MLKSFADQAPHKAAEEPGAVHASLTVFIPSSSNLTFFLKDGFVLQFTMSEMPLVFLL